MKVKIECWDTREHCTLKVEETCTVRDVLAAAADNIELRNTKCLDLAKKIRITLANPLDPARFSYSVRELWQRGLSCLRGANTHLDMLFSEIYN